MEREGRNACYQACPVLHTSKAPGVGRDACTGISRIRAPLLQMCKALQPAVRLLTHPSSREFQQGAGAKR